MAGVLRDGHTVWSMDRDEEGHRTYGIEHLVECDFGDGPFTILQTPGLPVPGAVWNFDSDFDPWAFCKPKAEIRPVLEKEPGRFFTVLQEFSTKPSKRCSDTDIEDPLLEPDEVSGDFDKLTEEATHDRFGSPIVTSSWEQIRGPQNEWPVSRPKIKIKQNVIDLQLPFLALMDNTVNDAPLWGFAARRILLKVGSWEEKYYGQCNKYFTRTLEFEINYRGWDREVLDEGTKALHGQNKNGVWEVTAVNPEGDMPSRFNPLHFNRYKDANGENAKVILNGRGVPYDPDGEGRVTWWWIDSLSGGAAFQGTYADASTLAGEFALYGPFTSSLEASLDAHDDPLEDDPFEPGSVIVEKLEESNFLVLGIPLIIG